VVVCLEQGTDLHIVHLMPLPLSNSCFTKIQIGFTFLVPAHLGSPGKRAVKRVCVCVCVCVLVVFNNNLDSASASCLSDVSHALNRETCCLCATTG